MIRPTLVTVLFLLLFLAAVPVAAAVPSSSTPAQDEESGPRATLTWRAQQDSRLYGYLVYRAGRREGPYRRISREIVHVTPPNAEGVSEYRFVDRDVIPGRTYFYYIETLGTDGQKARLSDILAKKVAEPG